MNRNIKNYVARYFPVCHFHLLTMINSAFLGMKLFWKIIYTEARIFSFTISLGKKGTESIIKYYNITKIQKVAKEYKYPSYNYIYDIDIIFDHLTKFKKNKRVLYFLQQDKFTDDILLYVFYHGRIDLAEYMIKKFPVPETNFIISNFEGLIFCHMNNLDCSISWYVSLCIEHDNLSELKKIKEYIEKEKLDYRITYQSFEEYRYLQNNNLIDEKLYDREKIDWLFGSH